LNELATNRALDWQLSRNENTRLRQALQRRIRGAPKPATVMAAGERPSSVSAP
jgi:hypothetical protein